MPCSRHAPCLFVLSANWIAIHLATRVAGFGQQVAPDLDEWPLQTMINTAVSNKPDIVVHVGDFLYRQSACPSECPAPELGGSGGGGNGGGGGGGGLTVKCACAGMGDEWGDTWQGWYADFLQPSLPLLRAAPWYAFVPLNPISALDEHTLLQHTICVAHSTRSRTAPESGHRATWQGCAPRQPRGLLRGLQRLLPLRGPASHARWPAATLPELHAAVRVWVIVF